MMVLRRRVDFSLLLLQLRPLSRLVEVFSPLAVLRVTLTTAAVSSSIERFGVGVSVVSGGDEHI